MVGGFVCGGGRVTLLKRFGNFQKVAQLDQFLARMQFWSIPHEKTMHAIELFGKYVIPHFRKTVTPGEAAAAASA